MRKHLLIIVLTIVCITAYSQSYNSLDELLEADYLPINRIVSVKDGENSTSFKIEKGQGDNITSFSITASKKAVLIGDLSLVNLSFIGVKYGEGLSKTEMQSNWAILKSFVYNYSDTLNLTDDLHIWVEGDDALTVEKDLTIKGNKNTLYIHPRKKGFRGTRKVFRHTFGNINIDDLYLKGYSDRWLLETYEVTFKPSGDQDAVLLSGSQSSGFWSNLSTGDTIAFQVDDATPGNVFIVSAFDKPSKTISFTSNFGTPDDYTVSGQSYIGIRFEENASNTDIQTYGKSWNVQDNEALALYEELIFISSLNTDTTAAVLQDNYKEFTFNNCEFEGMDYNLRLSGTWLNVYSNNTKEQANAISNSWTGGLANKLSKVIKNQGVVYDCGTICEASVNTKGVVSTNSVFGGGYYLHPAFVPNFYGVLFRDNNTTSYRNFSSSGNDITGEGWIGSFENCIWQSNNFEPLLITSKSWPTQIINCTFNAPYDGGQTTIQLGNSTSMIGCTVDAPIYLGLNSEPSNLPNDRYFLNFEDCVFYQNSRLDLSQWPSATESKATFTFNNSTFFPSNNNADFTIKYSSGNLLINDCFIDRMDEDANGTIYNSNTNLNAFIQLDEGASDSNPFGTVSINNLRTLKDFSDNDMPIIKGYDEKSSTATPADISGYVFNINVVGESGFTQENLSSVINSGGGGGSTQVADLMALAASSFPIGTLVTVQNTGATYKVEAVVPSGWNGDAADGTVVIADANSNFAVLQTLNESNLYLASHLGFDPLGATDGGAKARTLMPLLSEYRHGIYWDDGATFLLTTRDKASINGNPANANIISIDYDNFLWVGSGNEGTQAILDFRVADDIDNMPFDVVVGLYFNMVTESINNFTIDGVHIRGDQIPVHNNNTDLFVRTLSNVAIFKSPSSGAKVDRGTNWQFINNKFSRFHSLAGVNERAIIDGIAFNNNQFREWGYGFNLGQDGTRWVSESVTLNMPISSHTFSQIADVVHIRFHDGNGNDYGLINYNTNGPLMNIDEYGEITDYGNTNAVTWDISSATTDYTNATKATVTIGVEQDAATINDPRLEAHPSNCIELPTSRNVEILNNRFYDTGSSIYDHPIYLFRSCENLVISGNIFYNSDDSRIRDSGGFQIRGAKYKNVVISNNIFYNDGSAVFSIGDVDGIEIYNNQAITDFKSSNAQGRALLTFIGTENAKAYNNTYKGVLRRNSIAITGISGTNKNENLQIYNNSFEQATGIEYNEYMSGVELRGNVYVAAQNVVFGNSLNIADRDGTTLDLQFIDETYKLTDATEHSNLAFVFDGFSGFTLDNPIFIDQSASYSVGTGEGLADAVIKNINPNVELNRGNNYIGTIEKMPQGSPAANTFKYYTNYNTPTYASLQTEVQSIIPIYEQSTNNYSLGQDASGYNLWINSDDATDFPTTLSTTGVLNVNGRFVLGNNSYLEALDGSGFLIQGDRGGSPNRGGNIFFGTIGAANSHFGLTKGIRFRLLSDASEYTFQNSSNENLFNISTDGGIAAPKYGQGDFEDGDLSKTESAFVLVPATDGTILEKPISELGSGGYTFSSIQTSDITISIGEYNLVDPNGGAITATVPSGVTQVGTEFWVVDSEGTASGTNTITVDFSTNGYTVSGQNTAIINASGDGFKFIYIGSNKWISERL